MAVRDFFGLTEDEARQVAEWVKERRAFAFHPDAIPRLRLVSTRGS